MKNKTYRIISVFVSIVAVFNSAFAAGKVESTLKEAKKSLNERPLLFLENKGQIMDKKGIPIRNILFSAQSKGVKMYLNKNGISYLFMKNIEAPETESNNLRIKEKQKIKIEYQKVDMQLLNANLNATVVKQEKAEYSENYFLPNCGKNGITDVGSYSKVIYKDIYPNIDWIVYSKGQSFKYDFVVHPGGNPASIKMSYVHHNDLTANADGTIDISSNLGKISEEKPFTYQDSKSTSIESAFEKTENTLSFKIGKYDVSKDLVIDPGVYWGTFFGGSYSGAFGDTGESCATDADGNVYLVGNAYSTDLCLDPSLYTFSGTLNGNSDAYIAKFTTDGNLLWTSYYGGTLDDFVSDCKPDIANGWVYMSGYTQSADAPNSAFNLQPGFGGGVYDGFITEFDANGNLFFASFLGDTGDDYITSIDVTPSAGDLLLAGVSSSTSGIASGTGYQQVHGSGLYNAFLMKYDYFGNKVWGSYLGDDNFTQATAIGILEDGTNSNVFMIGTTTSSSSLSVNSSTAYAGGYDAFITKWDLSSGNVLSSRYMGGSGDDYGNDISVNINFLNILNFIGTTNSSSGIATKGQFSLGGGTDAFIGWSDYDLNQMEKSYFGGTGNEEGNACAFNQYGFIFGGKTNTSSGLTTSNALQPNFAGFADGFVASYDWFNLTPYFTSYFGAFHIDLVQAMSFSNNGQGPDIYLAGKSIGQMFTTNTGIVYGNAFQQYNRAGNGYNAFLAKLPVDCNHTPNPFKITSSTGIDEICAGSSLTLNVTGGSNYIWTGNVSGNSLLVNSENTYTVTGSAYGCPFSASKFIKVNALPDVVISPSGSQFICKGNSLALHALSTLNSAGNGSGINGISITPAGATADDSITITVSPALTCELVANLVGTNQARLHSGLGYDAFSYNSNTLSSTNSWQNAVAANDVDPTSWFTQQLNGSWTKTFVPRTYFNAPVDSNIKYLCMLVNGGPVGNMWSQVARNTVPNTNQCTGDYFIPFPLAGAITGGGNVATFKWYKNGTLIQGATDSIYYASTSGSYSVEVVNANNCSATSFPVQVTVNNPPPAFITPPASTSVCAGSSISLVANSAIATYQWYKDGNPIPGATASTYLANTTGNFTVKETSLNTCDSTSNVIAITVYPYPNDTITYNGEPYTCTGGTVTLQASTDPGLTYQWKINGVDIPGQTANQYTATQSGSYTCVHTNAGNCSSTSAAVVINPTPEPQQICLVSVDSLSQFNQVIWEKPVTTSIDSFRIYREDITNIYKYIASVGYNQLSLYIDTDLVNANPNAVTKRYKMATVDICGQVSPLGNYHNTIYQQDNGLGTFNWNTYTIENSANPVNSYILYRKDASTNNVWMPQTATAGTQNSVTYVDFFLHQNSQYRIETNWGISCTPTSKTMAGFNSSRSNIKNRTLTIPLNQFDEANISLVPNPASQSFMLKYPADLNIVTIKIVDNLGRLIKVLNRPTSKNNSYSVDVSDLAPSSYTVMIEGDNFILSKKLIKQ